MSSKLNNQIKNNKIEALILGAGRPNNSETPSALQKIDKKKNCT